MLDNAGHGVRVERESEPDAFRLREGMHLLSDLLDSHEMIHFILPAEALHELAQQDGRIAAPPTG